MVDKPKLTTQECADIIIFAIEQPQHIEIGELGFWIIDK
jgi:NADP-dependent 3-hydroxy acid dehydrogenase YdfG